jgi:hypothetical protein
MFLSSDHVFFIIQRRSNLRSLRREEPTISLRPQAKQMNGFHIEQDSLNIVKITPGTGMRCFCFAYRVRTSPYIHS